MIGEFLDRLEKGVTDPLTGTHYYWHEGINVVAPYKNLIFKIGGKFMIDYGRINADSKVQNAFPGIEDEQKYVVARYLMPAITGSLTERVDFKIEMDFASIRNIKEIWVDFKKIPYLGHVKVGHFGQPMSLEDQTSSRDITFMERALPVLIFPPGLAMGIMGMNKVFNDRMTWAVGYFLVTSSFSNLGEASDQLGHPLGASVAGRLTYLPIYENEGKNLLHIGLSYNHNSIDTSRDDAQARLSVRPETYLTNETLVDTGYFLAEQMDIINPELALVNGPFSVQGEYFLMATKAGLAENPVFRGWYVQTSYFLTGEHRPYDRLYGCFDRVRPQKNFSPLQGHWGAWEVAMRYSALDLNDRNIQGGKQRDFTVGLNWYLYPTVRVMFNYVHSEVEDRGNPPIDRGNLNIFQMRLQFAF